MKSLNKKFQQRRSGLLDTGKDKTSTIKIKCKKCYNLLIQKNTYIKKAPTKQDIETFWKEIFGKKVQHNEEAY